MTDFETKYRDLVAGLEALADEWGQNAEGYSPPDPSWAYVARNLRALLASSPAEKVGEGPCAFCRGCHPAELDHCINLPGCTSAPVSSGEAGKDYCDCGQYGCPNPARVVAPSTEREGDQ